MSETMIREFTLYEPLNEWEPSPTYFETKIQKYLYKLDSSTEDGQLAGKRTFFTQLRPGTKKVKRSLKKHSSVLQEKSLMQMKAFNYIENAAQWQNFQQPEKKNLYDLMENRVLRCVNPDFYVYLGPTMFRCHKIVFQMHSNDYLNIVSKNFELSLDEISPEGFWRTYKWMLGKCEELQREYILDMYNAAKYLHIQDLADLCFKYIDDPRRFNEDSAMMLYFEARKYKMQSLQQVLITRINKCFLSFVASKEFLELDVTDLCCLLEKSCIGVNTEVEVFMACIRWISHNWKKRFHKIPLLITKIRFGLIPPQLLVRFLTTVDCVYIKKICSLYIVKKSIDDAIVYSANGALYKDRPEILTTIYRPNICDDLLERHWIFDADCPYHHSMKCEYVEQISYSCFLKYLDMVCNSGPFHWQMLRKPKSRLEPDQSCENSKCIQLMKIKTAEHEKERLNDKAKEDEIQQYFQRESQEYAEARKRRVENLNAQTNQQESDSQNLDHLLDMQNEESSTSYKKSHDNYATTSQAPKMNDLKDLEDFFGQTLPQSNWKSFRLDDETASTSAQSALSLSSLSGLNFKHYKETKLEDRFEGTAALSSSISARIESTKELFELQSMILIGGVNPYCSHCMRLKTPKGGPPVYNDNFGKEVLIYDEKLKLWRKLCHTPFPLRYHHAAVQCNNSIFIIGGNSCVTDCMKEGQLETSIWRLDVRHSSWRQETVLPEPRRDFAAVAIDKPVRHCKKSNCAGYLGIGFFIIGGEGENNKPLDSVLFYDVMKKKWTQKASLNISRYGLSAALVNDELWVAGGMTLTPKSTFNPEKGKFEDTLINSMTDSIETLKLKCDGSMGCANCDPHQNMRKWTISDIKLRLPYSFGKLCKYSDQDLFYVGGASVDLITGRPKSMPWIDYFNKSSRKWEIHGELNHARQGHGAVIIKNRLIVVGGINCHLERALTEVEVYNVQKKSFTNEVCNIPIPKSGLTLIAFNRM